MNPSAVDAGSDASESYTQYDGVRRLT